MNLFTIELIQTAISLLPFLIAFSLIFSRGLGIYWILPTLAFIINSAYRGYMLYLASPGDTLIMETRELAAAFAPSMVNLVLFFAMLSIQISLQRNRNASLSETQMLLDAPQPSPDPETADEGKKKILLQESPPIRSEASTAHHEQMMQQMREQIALIKEELNKTLELAAFNGQLKKPRKRKKVPKRRKKRTP